MKKVSLLFLLLVSLTMQAQLDCELYFANNVGQVQRVSKITENDTELNWKLVSDGAYADNKHDVEEVQEMFKSKRQKTRDDQRLFWKMRDDNLLCFRINDGKGKYGEYEAKVMTADKKHKKEMIVTGYFFVNTDHETDTLLITLNKKGCRAIPADTLHFKYYVYDWGNDRLALFKLDSRRQNTGLTYQLEYKMQNLERQKFSIGYRELSGKSFQSILVPNDSILTDVFLVSNGQRLRLKDDRLRKGANLSARLETLWMNTNFTLDKHVNRELTIFNMLGTGLFEKYDTLKLTVMGKNGPVEPTSFNEKTQLAGGFDFKIAEVDADGKYVNSGVQMAYVGYDKNNKKHKILTYGKPCYIEVYAPGCLPGLYKYAGAVDPKTNELNENRVTGTIYLTEGTTSASEPAISTQTIYVLKTTDEEKLDGDTKYPVYAIASEDMGIKPSSGTYMFIANGGDEGKKWLKEKGQYVTDYAEVSVAYSVPKNVNNGNVATLVLEEKGSNETTKELDKISLDVINGNDYPSFLRSWYTQRWNLATLKSGTSGDYVMKEKVEYKPRLTISGRRFNQMRYIRRQKLTLAQMKKEAEEKAKDYAFNKSKIDPQYNGFQGFSLLGQFAKLDLRADKFPGLEFWVAPTFEPLRGILEFDVNASIGLRHKEKEGKKTGGQLMRENLKEQDRLHRFKWKEIPSKNGWNVGANLSNASKTSKVTKDFWVQSELDDIFKVETNKLGFGWAFDIHFGFGCKLWNFLGSDDNSDQSWYLKGLDGFVSYGGYAAGRCDPFSASEIWNKMPVRLMFYGVATGQVQVGLGLKTYNFTKNGDVIHRSQGFFLNGKVEAKAGVGVELKARFFGNDQTTELEENQKHANLCQKTNRALGISGGGRFGGKLQLAGGVVKLFDRERWDKGASFMALFGAELYFDFRIGPVLRWNPRLSKADAFFKAWPDDDSNPTIPTYPNYPIKHDDNDYWKAPRRAAIVPPVFPLSNLLAEGLTYRATPYFMGENRLVMSRAETAGNPNSEHLKEFALPTAEGAQMTVSEGKDMKSNGHFEQNHHAAKEGPVEMVVYEEMTRDFDQAYLEKDHTADEAMEHMRFMQIASSSRNSETGEWQKHVIAYDENLQDFKPVTAVNVIYKDEETVDVSYNAACLWKRGKFVLPDYADEDDTEEQNAEAKTLVENSDLRSFEGDLMLSLFDGTKWSAPESVLKLGKNDIMSDYQVVMSDGDVLAAAIVLPADKDQPELRYFSKKKGQAVMHTYTDVFNPISFSLDMVGTNPTIAILHRVDSANCDIFVKQVDMDGHYSELGTALTIARYNPQSVKIVVDKEAADAYPTDFAVVWQCVDRIIRRDGKDIRTDSTQTMLNCSRMYMLDNITATPYITLGCTADSTQMSGYDVFLDGFQVKTLYTLTDVRNGNTYLMKDEVQFSDNFEYSISPSDETMTDEDYMPVALTIRNTGSTPITYIEGWLNEQQFYFNNILINPYSTQTLTVDYLLLDDYNGLMRAHDVTAVFEDKWSISKATRRRKAPISHSVKSDKTETDYAAGLSDLKCELLSQTINGTENKVYVELTDYDVLNEDETVHLGLYPDHMADVPICSTAEVLLKANDFISMGGERKAWAVLTVDGLTEAQDVELRARVYNDKVLAALGSEEDDIRDAIVDNLSWQENQRIITLLPVELDDVTGMPVVTDEQREHRIHVETTPDGIWVSGLEEGDHVRIFDAGARPCYQNRQPGSRLFVPIQEHGVYLLTAGKDVVKFIF